MRYFNAMKDEYQSLIKTFQKVWNLGSEFIIFPLFCWLCIYNMYRLFFFILKKYLSCLDLQIVWTPCSMILREPFNYSWDHSKIYNKPGFCSTLAHLLSEIILKTMILLFSIILSFDASGIFPFQLLSSELT